MRPVVQVLLYPPRMPEQQEHTSLGMSLLEGQQDKAGRGGRSQTPAAGGVGQGLQSPRQDISEQLLLGKDNDRD